jgi:hypothetical protein
MTVNDTSEAVEQAVETARHLKDVVEQEEHQRSRIWPYIPHPLFPQKLLAESFKFAKCRLKGRSKRRFTQNSLRRRYAQDV